MKGRKAKQVKAYLLTGYYPAFTPDGWTVAELEKLAGELEVVIEAKAGAGDDPVKDDYLRDLEAALEDVTPSTADICRAACITPGCTPEEAKDLAHQLHPDTSMSASRVRYYAREHRRKEDDWWEAHGAEVKEHHPELLERQQARTAKAAAEGKEETS